MTDRSNTETNSNASSNNSKRNSKSTSIIAVVAVILIAVLIGVIVVLVKKIADTKDQQNQDTRATVSTMDAAIVTEDNLEEYLANEQQQNESYVCEMNVDWHFEDSTKPSYNAQVTNAVENTRTVYFDLALEPDMQILYSSPYIPVGASVDEVKLNTELDAGTYPAVVVYHLVDDDKNEVGSVTVTVTLYIEN